MIRKILLAFLIFTSLSLTAQRTNSSPYSFFGIGQEFNVKTVQQASMGGIGVAFSNSYSLNFTNPAANANIRFATYSFGMLNNDLSIDDASGTQSSTSTSLNYIAFGFPLGEKAGVSVGLQPLSSVGYSLTNRQFDTITDELSEISLYTGTGGVNRIYGSFGIEVFKGLSLGLEADFTFGKIENGILNQRADVQLATKYTQTANIRGGSVKLGAQYKKHFENKLRLDFGAVLKLSSNLDATGTESLNSLSVTASGAEIPRDQLFTNVLSGSFNSPLETTIGFGLGQTSKWYAGLEYEYQDAVNLDGYLINSGAAFAYDNSNRISFGGFYLPKINSISNYFSRVTYRAGIRFEKTGLLVDGTTTSSSTSNNFTSIDDFGISFGLGLPLGRKLSNVNLGFEFGKKGTTNNNLIQENYFNFRLSLSLSDTWFIKRKID
jgi:hypothetical protein